MIVQELSFYPKSNSSLIQDLKEKRKYKEKEEENPNLHYGKETLILLSTLRILASWRGIY